MRTNRTDLSGSLAWIAQSIDELARGLPYYLQVRIHLQYGHDGLDVDLPGDVTVLEPRFVEGLPDERAAFQAAVRRPLGARPLAEVVSAGERLAIVIPDITRPLPTDRLLPWVLEELRHIPLSDVVIINGTGSHRVNTPDELRDMVGASLFERCAW